MISEGLIKNEGNLLMGIAEKKWLKNKKDSLTLFACVGIFGISVTICAIMAYILINSEPRGYGDINGWVQALASLASLVISAITILFIFFTFKSSKDALEEQRLINIEQMRYNEESLQISSASARPWPLVGKIEAKIDPSHTDHELKNVFISFNIKNYASIPCVKTVLRMVVLDVSSIDDMHNIESSIHEYDNNIHFLPGTIGPNEEQVGIVDALIVLPTFKPEKLAYLEARGYHAKPYIVIYWLKFTNPVDGREIIDKGELVMRYYDEKITIGSLTDFERFEPELCYS